MVPEVVAVLEVSAPEVVPEVVTVPEVPVSEPEPEQEVGHREDRRVDPEEVEEEHHLLPLIIMLESPSQMIGELGILPDPLIK